MKEFIQEQLELHKQRELTTEGQINEIGLSSILGKLRDKFSSKNAILNRKFAKIVGEKFEGEFGNYLTKKLVKSGKSVNTIKTLVDYLGSSTSENYAGVFEIIGLPMIDFFLQKTFGKASVKGMIKQNIPLLKKVSTGNKELDTVVLRALNKVLKTEEIRNNFKAKLKASLDSKLGELLDDQDFWDIFQDSQGNNTSEGVEQIDEVGSLGDKIKSKSPFGFKKVKNQLTIANWVLRYIPRLKRTLQTKIYKKLKEADYEDMYNMMKHKKTRMVGELIAPTIMQHIVKNARDLYFKEAYFSELTDMMDKVFTNDVVVAAVEDRIGKYMRYNIKKIQKKRRQLAAKPKRKF